MTALAALASFARHRHEGRPHVADDDPPSSFAALLREMAPRPGRLAATLRITLGALVVIVLSETFQVSNVAVNAYLVFVLFKADANASVRVSIVGAVAIVVAILVAIVLFAATLAEAALRIPLIAIVSFGAMFLMRGSTLGVGAFVGGIFIISSLNDGDNLKSEASAAYYPTNTTSGGAPSILFISPEEALVHNLLFEALGVVIAVLVIVVVNKLTASDPEKTLRAALADRIAAAAAFCAGEPSARSRLVACAKAGTASLSAQSALIGQVKRVPHLVAAGDAVIAAIGRLVPTLLAFRRLPDSERDTDALAAWARPLSVCEAEVRQDHGPARAYDAVPPPERTPSAAAALLLAQVADGVTALQAAIHGPRTPVPRKGAGGFFKEEAFADPACTQFALKTTLALMACYIFMNLTDWSQISTCMTTCFVVALETVGQSFFKMMSRMTGAAIGAAIGFLAILYVMPMLTDIGQLMLLLAPVLFASAWVRAGGDRINYIGQQMAFAFMLMVLQKYGPTLDYDTGRDRVVGILVGEVAITVVFTQLWPVRVADAVRQRVGGAFAALGAALSVTSLSAADATAAQTFGATIGAARGMLVDDPYEPEDLMKGRERGRIDGDVLEALQAALVPLTIVTAIAPSSEAKDEALARHRHALAAWLGRAAAWVERGRGGRGLTQALPTPPERDASPDAGDRDVLAAREWYAILDRELREVLQKAHMAHAGERLAA